MIKFGQIIQCKFSKGSFQNSDFSGLEFDFPTSFQIEDSYIDLMLNLGISTNNPAQNAFNNLTPTVLGSVKPGSGGDVKATRSDPKMSQPYQIPNAHLPIETKLPHGITSIMGARPDPFKPGKVQAKHGGVDIGQATGSPLFAVFDGTVVSIGKSSVKDIPNKYIPDVHGIYKQVGRKGYGVKVVTRHKELNLL